MKEKIKKYIDLIPRDEFPKWEKVLQDESGKVTLKNVLSCLVEKGIVLDDYEQMIHILWGLDDSLTVRQIMLYVEPKIKRIYWSYIRGALTRGVPVEVIEPIINENFTCEKLNEIEEKYFNEQHEKDKKAFIDSLFLDGESSKEE